MADNSYEGTLDEASHKKAEKELSEDPKQRMSAVETLRKWIEERKDWIRVPTDTNYLLSFLRMKKFNQILTRQSLVTAWELRTKHPEWYKDFDPADPKVLAVISTGFYYPLPGRDKQGRKIIMMKCGNTSTTGKDYLPDHILRGFITLHDYLPQDENIQVNGYVYLMDMTGFSMSHVKFSGPERFIKGTECWMKAHTGRNKEMHFYNGGSMFDVFYGLIKQGFPKKVQDRVKNHKNNFSTVYNYIDKSMLPTEYLPDDYDGPSAGPKQKILEDYIATITSPEYRAYTASLSNGQYFVYPDKKPQKGEDEAASFRQIVDDHA